MLFDRGQCHAKDMPLLGDRFRRRAVFKLLAPKAHTKLSENQFLDKSDHLTGNFQNIATKEFMWTLIYVGPITAKLKRK